MAEVKALRSLHRPSNCRDRSVLRLRQRRDPARGAIDLGYRTERRLNARNDCYRARLEPNYVRVRKLFVLDMF